MPFHRLTPAQQSAVKGHIVDQKVYDLGAGDCASSVLLADLGAGEVIAVDVARFPVEYPEITQLQVSFEELVPHIDTIDVAFISWPINRFNPNLLTLIQRSETVIYLGSNTNANACGDPRYFREFRSRELLAYVPDMRNTLMICGDRLPEPRPLDELHGEEVAGLTMYESDILWFEDVENRFPRFRSNPLDARDLESFLVEAQLKRKAIKMYVSGAKQDDIARTLGVGNKRIRVFLASYKKGVEDAKRARAREMFSQKISIADIRDEVKVSHKKLDSYLLNLRGKKRKSRELDWIPAIDSLLDKGYLKIEVATLLCNKIGCDKDLAWRWLDERRIIRVSEDEAKKVQRAIITIDRKLKTKVTEASSTAWGTALMSLLDRGFKKSWLAGWLQEGLEEKGLHYERATIYQWFFIKTPNAKAVPLLVGLAEHHGDGPKRDVEWRQHIKSLVSKGYKKSYIATKVYDRLLAENYRVGKRSVVQWMHNKEAPIRAQVLFIELNRTLPDLVGTVCEDYESGNYKLFQLMDKHGVSKAFIRKWCYP
jgi:hypothetical protein